MYFEDITTPSEQKRGFVDAVDLLKRCLESEDYLKQPIKMRSGCRGWGWGIASIYFDGKRYGLSVNKDLDDADLTGVFLTIEETREFVDPDTILTIEDLRFEDYVPLNQEAFIACVCAKIGIQPSTLLKEGVDYDAFCDGEGVEDFSSPPPGMHLKYPLMQK